MNKLEAGANEIKTKHSAVKSNNEMQKFVEFTNSVDFILTLFSSLSRGEKFYKELQWKMGELTGYIDDYLIARNCEKQMLLNEIALSENSPNAAPISPILHIPAPVYNQGPNMGMYGNGGYPSQGNAPYAPYMGGYQGYPSQGGNIPSYQGGYPQYQGAYQNPGYPSAQGYPGGNK